MANRFKKSMESVHPTESVTDLKTAGISPANKETETIAEIEITNDERTPTDGQNNTNMAKTTFQLTDNDIPAEPEPPQISYTADVEDHPMPSYISEGSIHDNKLELQQENNDNNAKKEETAISLSSRLAQADNRKKNVPNMFTRKSESKSIRKSLVLRPSSVKIAEDYCAQNGGSFNELIQILLDNFIEEYGL